MDDFTRIQFLQWVASTDACISLREEYLSLLSDNASVSDNTLFSIAGKLLVNEHADYELVRAATRISVKDPKIGNYLSDVYGRKIKLEKLTQEGDKLEGAWDKLFGTQLKIHNQSKEAADLLRKL